MNGTQDPLEYLLDSLPPYPLVDEHSRSGREPLPPGTKLGDGSYTLDEEIGYGSFGVIYAASEPRVGQDLAIKEFFPKGARRGEDRPLEIAPGDQWEQSELELLKNQFREEYLVLERFERPGIVKVYDLFGDRGGLFLVMERLRGGTLDQILASRGRLSETEALAIISRLTSTLETIHLSGLVHGDIKPENLFLTFDREVILLDFGAVNHYLTQDRKSPRFLTPGYAPPEQYQSHRPPDPSSDIYALGATLYELLCGQPPPDAKERLQGRKLPSPIQFGGVISNETISALAKTLALVSERRPASAPELKQLFPMPVLEDSNYKGVLEPLEPWIGHEQGVVGLKLTKDGRFLVSSDRKGETRLWSLEEERCLGVIKFGQEIVYLTLKSDDNTMALAFRGGWVELVDLASGQGIGSVREGNPPVSSLAFSPDGLQLACGLSSGHVELWDMADGEPLAQFRAHEGPINQLNFSPTGRLLALASNDRKVSVWDLKSKRRLRHFDENRRPVQCARFCTKGNFLMTGGADMVLRLYDLKQGDEFRRLRGHEAMVWDVEYRDDLARAFSCSSDRTLRVWDTRNFRELAKVQVSDGWLQSLAFSPYRNEIYTAGVDGKIYRYQLLETSLSL